MYISEPLTDVQENMSDFDNVMLHTQIKSSTISELNQTGVLKIGYLTLIHHFLFSSCYYETAKVVLYYINIFYLYDFQYCHTIINGSSPCLFIHGAPLTFLVCFVDDRLGDRQDASP